MTRARVFIIESLKPEDEKAGNFEGRVLSQILHLGDKESEYHYVRNKRKLNAVLRRFGKSDYRYLHLSCHGNEGELAVGPDTSGSPLSAGLSDRT